MRLLKCLLFSISILFVYSCGEGEDTISGKYRMTDLQFTGCQDPLAVDLVFDNGGLCTDEDGVYTCVFFCLDFSETSLTINLIGTEDGVEVININQSATFDPNSETIDFCLPSGDCDDVIISDNKDKITFFGFDSDTGCDFEMVLERS